jgi:hypothetical protein
MHKGEKVQKGGKMRLARAIAAYFWFLAILCGLVRWSQESEIFSSYSLRSVTLRFYSVTPGFDYSATNINRRDAEFAETWKFTFITST